MKKLYTIISIMLLTMFAAVAQVPERFSYQAVVRNASNSLVANAQVGVRVNILQGSATGSAVYSESHVATTNANGLLTVNIGGGSVLHGSFAGIDWADGPYFLKTDIDPNGGNDYTITSVQQLLSVPYALYAKEAGNGFSGDYNDLTNRPQIPQIPADVSAFNNDAGYITAQDIPAIPTVPTDVSAFNNDAGYLTSFTEQQVLSISNDTLFLTGGSFVKLPAGFDGDYNSLTNKPELFSGDYNDLTNRPQIPQIPTDVSAFNNDAGYITAQDIPAIPTVPTNVSAFSNDAGYLTSYTENQILNISNDTLFLTGGSFVKLPAGFDGDYNSLTNKPELFSGDYNDLTNLPQITQIPADVSAFNNDAGYITSYTESQILSISNDTLFLTGGSFVKLPAGFDGDYNSLTNKPELFSGDYNDLTNKPTLFDGNYNSLSNRPNLAAVATTGNYNDLNNLPQIPQIPADVSAFNNDAGYITNSGSNCDNTVNLCELMERLAQLENMLNVLTVRTAGVTAVTENTFTVEGEVVNDGGATVTQRGFVYATTHNPTISNNMRNVGTGTGTFSTTITSLAAGTTYYVRAFATNVNGTVYGSEVAVTTTATSPSAAPSVTTVAVIDVTKTQATVRGNVTSDGGETVIERGFVYDTLANPTTSSNIITSGNGTGSFANIILNLLPGKTYYVRAYAKNVVGIAYGSILSFTTMADNSLPVDNDGQPCPGTPTVTDHEGNIYNTVRIGTQCWTKENMRAITSPSTGTYLIRPNGLSETYTGKQALWSFKDSATYAPRNYGVVYNWNAAVDTFNTQFDELSCVEQSNYTLEVAFNEFRRGICPPGWHIPSKVEFEVLLEYVGNQDVYCAYADYGNRTWIAKSLAATTDWTESSNTMAIGNGLATNNLTGFSLLPAQDGGVLSSLTYLWSATSYQSPSYGNLPYYIYFQNRNPDYRLECSSWGASAFRSVRCLRDSAVTEEESPVIPDTTGQSTTDTLVDAQPCPGAPTVTDYDGNVYNTVQIGQQCWMAENLRTTKNPDGTDIPLDNGRYNPNGDANYVAVYGYLYTWYAMMNGASSSSATPSGVRGICPNGWHVPSFEEWKQLFGYAIGQSQFLCGGTLYNYAKALASATGWNSDTTTCAIGNNPNDNNVSGFSALPSGYSYEDSLYNGFQELGFFWTSSEYNDILATNFDFVFSQGSVSPANYDKNLGMSVRCLRD